MSTRSEGEPAAGRTGFPRWLEVVLSGAALVVLAPVLGTAAVLVMLTSNGPPVFRQARMGRGGRPFILLKLRTMRPEPTGSAVTAGGDPRITGVGRWLRKTKLDELPGLWNVLTGDMSFVGPRPEVPSMVDLADAEWGEVLAMRPGLTDPVTLALRNEEDLLREARDRSLDVDVFYRTCLLPWKLRRTIAYGRRRTVGADARVLLETLLSVVSGQAVAAPSLDEILMDPETIDTPDTRG